MLILQEIKNKGIETISNSHKVYCKMFKDESGALQLARMPKIRPRTKHINVLYHHFGSYIRDYSISIFSIDTFNQIMYILANPLLQNDFLRHRKKKFKW